MADIEDRLAFGFQALQRFKQLVGFLRRQHRSRLIQNDEIRLLKKAAHNFDTLAFANRQITNMGLRINRKSVRLANLMRTLCNV